MNFYALIEELSNPDESLLFFRELPGCFVTAPTTREALQQAPGAIAEYARWLQQHNIFFFEKDISSITIVVKEILRAESVGPRFVADLPAPTDQERDNALQVARVARAQLADLYNAVVPAHRGRPVKPEEWSLTDHLEHVLRAEAHYVSCLSDQVPESLPPIPEGELAFKLMENGKSYEAVLRGLTPAQRTRLYLHGEAEWTAAKTLRRMTKHVREHYPWMMEIADRLSGQSQEFGSPS